MCRRLSSVGRIRVPRRRSSINKWREKKLPNWICFVLFCCFWFCFSSSFLAYSGSSGSLSTLQCHWSSSYTTQIYYGIQRRKVFEVVVIWCEEISFAPNWQIKMEWQLTNHDQTHSNNEHATKQRTNAQKHEFFMSLSNKIDLYMKWIPRTRSYPNFGTERNKKLLFPYSLSRH